MNEFDFVEVDSAEITQKLINAFEAYTGETLPVGDARRQMLSVISYAVVVMINDINTTGKNNLLRFATGNALDELGKALYSVIRLDAEPATVELKFILSNAQATAVEIPKGTRATADGKIFFATDEDLIIASGGTDGIVTATATVSGEVGNGFIAGQIANIVDGVPYVDTVTNTNTSTNGRDVETDDEYRERIRIAPFSFSTAGAREAYKYLALSANPNVGDADPYRTSAGSVTVAVVKKDGTLPEEDSDILKDVENACSAKTARPLTDNVTVAAATPVNDAIDVTYYISVDDSATATQIQAQVEKAVNDYVLWQTTKIGRDINPDRLRSLMYNAGAYSVTVTAPTEKAVNDGEVAQFTSKKITYGGLKD